MSSHVYRFCILPSSMLCSCSQISRRPGVRANRSFLHASVSLCARILTPEVSTRHDSDTDKHFEMPCVWTPSSQCDARRRGHACNIEAENSLRWGPTPALRLMLPWEWARQGGRRNLWTHGSQEGGREDPHMQWGFILVLWPCVIHLVVHCSTIYNI